MNLIRPLFILITGIALSGCGDREPIQVNKWRINTGLNLTQPIKVLHISDIHYQEDTGPAVMAELAQIAGATQPDFVALTGDYTGEDLATTDRIRPVIIDGLERLSEGRRTYVTLGNHETYTGPNRWIRSFSDSPIRFIEGQSEIINILGVDVCVRGLGDAFTDNYRHIPFSDDCTGIKLTLVHDPYGAEIDPESGVYLAGHLHAGQISLPLVGPIWMPTKASEEYWVGYGSDGNKQWITSAGVGTTFIDVRIGTTASVELIELY
ncbi:metallophosphoesterase [Marinobacterium sp. xm-m-312]|uniref:metallophosphoesterase n=1 Tax=Marinobacterium sp. xm-m-312 TaxID=2497741 RepID=UPI00156969A2|nr:metallophosphoesterase [Marinobacterium sp. xm-m-312]NRQ24570.1 phosphodiesterase YaeI [Marinobacterium sp. xm-m-312]